MADSARDPRYHAVVPGVPGRAWLIANPAQSFQAELDPQGLRLELEDGAPVALGAAGLRCGGQPAALPEGEVVGSANRVEVRRGPMVEWFLNGAPGLEQGFTLERAACPEGADEITLTVSLAGLIARDSADGARLVDAQGHARLGYSELWAEDARGRGLPARMKATPEGIELRVAARGAAWPVTVDPLLWVLQQKLIASDGAPSDGFGAAVAIQGDTALVGAYLDNVGLSGDQGSVYVFARSGATWSQQQKIVAADGAAGDYFGSRVVLDADTALIESKASAYVFVRSGGVFSLQQKIPGGSVKALRGDTALLGVAVWERSGGVWAKTHTFAPEDNPGNPNYEMEIQFGAAGALSPNAAYIGAPGYPGYLGVQNGAVYTFYRQGSSWNGGYPTVWQKGLPDDRLGSALAASDTTDEVMAGGWSAELNYPFQGMVFVLPAGYAIFASDGKAYDYFGLNVAFRGGRMVVRSSGSAYVFDRDPTTKKWTQSQKLPLTQAPGASNPIALSGDTVLLGNPGEDIGGNYKQGSASVYVLAGGACTSAAQCASGHCVDSVCCDTSCGGGAPTDCLACSVAAGAASDGVCAPRAAASDCGSNAVSECDGPDQCDASGACLSNAKPAGTTCGSGAVSECDGPDQCDGAGSCLPNPKPAGAACGSGASSECNDPDQCDGAGSCLPNLKPAGTACGDQGVPCLLDDACDGVGSCTDNGAKPAGTLCRPAAGDCDVAELCDGVSGACPADTLQPSSHECRAASCAAGVAILPATCTGSAVACPPLQTESCAPTVCAGTQCGGCATDAQCPGSHYCAAGVCAAKLNVGQVCGAATECLSGFCADGVCCATDCAGQCQACAEPGTEGSCVTVTGAPRAPRPGCSGSGACGGACDGVAATACAYPGSSTTCAPAACAGDDLVPASKCDGGGVCAAGAAQSCKPYGCDAAASACRTSCATAADCAAGYACAAGACQASGTGGAGGAAGGATGGAGGATGGVGGATGGVGGAAGGSTGGAGGAAGGATGGAGGAKDTSSDGGWCSVRRVGRRGGAAPLLALAGLALAAMGARRARRRGDT
jgi:hypothetical protein